MPRTAFSVVTSKKEGVAYSLGAVDATNGNSFLNNGDELLLVNNASASAVTVTIVSVPDVYGRTGDISLSVPANSSRVFGPFPTYLFNQPDGTVNVNFSAGASVTAAVISWA